MSHHQQEYSNQEEYHNSKYNKTPQQARRQQRPSHQPASSKYHHAASNSYHQQQGAAQQPSAGRKLPGGWRRYYDNVSNVEYYWNEINAESTWYFPTVTATEWIKQRLLGGATAQNDQHHGATGSYSERQRDTHHGGGSARSSDHEGNGGGTGGEQQQGWNSDRGYYEDQEFSDPYNDWQGGATTSYSNDDTNYHYGYGANTHHQYAQAGYYGGNGASTDAHGYHSRPTTGASPPRLGRRNSRTSKARSPAPPPGRKGLDHGVHFPDFEAMDTKKQKALKALRPAQVGRGKSKYAVDANAKLVGGGSAHGNEEGGYPVAEPTHFTFDNADVQKTLNPLPARSLSMLGKALFKVDGAAHHSKVEIGDYISVMYNERWRIAQVLDFRDSEVPWVRVEIEGNPKVEEWIEFQSERLAPFGANGAMSPARKHVKVLSRQLSLADYVEVRDTYTTKAEKKAAKWRMAQIVAVDVDGSITVQYAGQDGAIRADEKIAATAQKKRIRPLGDSPAKKTTGSPVAPLSLSEATFHKRLKDAGLVIDRMTPDGNCLFRAVAHQVYGDADQHQGLRDACCSYMLSTGQREHLENFVDGDFEKYVAKMRKAKTWGGNLEIEAMQEMFDRPIVIYSAESTGEAGMFKKDFTSPNIPETPRGAAAIQGTISLKISYHGKSHYNSIVDPKHPPPLLPLESSRLQQSRKRREAALKTLGLSEEAGGKEEVGAKGVAQQGAGDGDMAEKAGAAPKRHAVETKASPQDSESKAGAIKSNKAIPPLSEKEKKKGGKGSFFKMPWNKKKKKAAVAPGLDGSPTKRTLEPIGSQPLLVQHHGGRDDVPIGRKELPSLDTKAAVNGLKRVSLSSPSLTKLVRNKYPENEPT